MRLILIGGFLGSGKTSLLSAMVSELLDRKLRLLILKNEAGKAAVDTALLARPGVDIQNILGGCACCDLRPRLLECLEQIKQRNKYDLVLLEPSGVANLADLVGLLRQYSPLGGSIQSVVVLDATRLPTLYRALPEMLNAQLQTAQAVVLSKIDLAQPAIPLDLIHQLGCLNASTPVWQACLTSGHARIIAGDLLDWFSNRIEETTPSPFNLLQKTQSAHFAQAFTLALPENGVSANQLQVLVSTLTEEILTPERPGHLKLLALDPFGSNVVVSATGRRDVSTRGDAEGALKGQAILTVIVHGRQDGDLLAIVMRHAAKAIPEAIVSPWPISPTQ
jgi:G3E family GTPase